MSDPVTSQATGGGSPIPPDPGAAPLAVTVPGKPHTRTITISGLVRYLAATGWVERLDRIIPHEPGPHPFYRDDSKDERVYFADGWPPHLLTGRIIEIARMEGREPVDVLDAIAAMEDT